MDFLVRRDDLHETKIEDSRAPEVGDGEALFAISRFGLSANNVTYAVMGDAMNYWNFFPAEEGWGRLPVWGFADIVASNADGVEEGARCYGYFPASSHLAVLPDRADADGFFDSASHRRSLPPVYNHYLFTGKDPNYAEETEDEQMLLRPLFGTSFLLDDELADESWSGAQNLVMSSSSSKTALAAAFLIARRDDAPELIGLTSASRVGFVEGTGVYSQVVSYDDIGSMGSGSAAYLDFSGDAGVRKAVHENYSDDLVRDTAIGLTHHDQMGDAAGLPGAEPKFFFAPTRAAKRTEDWGADGLRQQLAAAWDPFVEWAPGWLRVSEGSGPEAIEKTYHALLDGNVDPADGYAITPA